MSQPKTTTTTGLPAPAEREKELILNGEVRGAARERWGVRHAGYSTAYRVAVTCFPDLLAPAQSPVTKIAETAMSDPVHETPMTSETAAVTSEEGNLEVIRANVARSYD